MAECWLDLQGTSTEPYDSEGHGSHVMGTMCGRAIHVNGDTITVGAAPNAEFICCNAVDQGLSEQLNNDVITAYQWFIDPDGDPNTTDDDPDVIQNSWGVYAWYPDYGPCYSFWNTAILNCEAAGTVVIWSAGNDGAGTSTIGIPPVFAYNPTQIFSVGAVDATNNQAPFPIAWFSSRGPSSCEPDIGAFKPEVVAPGVDVFSVMANSESYTTMSGTSMSGPHVAGVIALLREACPDCDPQTLKEILLETAIDTGYPPVGEDNTYGMGLVNAYDAVQEALEMSVRGFVDGVITNESGSPLAGVHVQTVNEHPFANSNLNGYYCVRAQPGIHSFQFSKYGYNTQLVENVEAFEDDTTHLDVSMQSLPHGTLSGVVQVQSGAAIPNAAVLVLNTPLDTVYTDGSGRFSVTLPADDYSVYIEIVYYLLTPRVYSADTTVTISANETTDIVVTIFVPMVEPIGPDDHGYSAFDRIDRDSPANYDWVELNPDSGGSGTSFTFSHHDSAVYFAAPLPLIFYGQDYDSLTVSANGWMLPGVHHGAGRFNTPIPFADTGVPHGVIAPYWDDFRIGINARQWSWYDVANGRWIFEFTDERLVTPTTYLFAWQVHFYSPIEHPTLTGDAKILFVYKHVPYLSGCTIGIESPTQTTGLQVLDDGELNINSLSIDSTTAILFTTGSPVAFGTVEGTITTYPPAENISSATIRMGIRTTSVDAQGHFHLDSIPSGLQTLSLTLAGYEPRFIERIRVGDDSVTTHNLDAWRLDAPYDLSASQNSGNIHLSWRRPQSIQQYPANWVMYTVLRNDITVISSLMDTVINEHVPFNMTAYYRVIAQYRNGTSRPSDTLAFIIDLSVNEAGSLLPEEFSLSQNYPNPFNPNTHIKLAVPAVTNGSLRIYDLNGRLVRVLAEGSFEPGYHEYVWDGCNESFTPVAAGMYFYKFDSEKYSATKKMLLIK